MKWGSHSGPRGYHHGNLKEALVRAALDLIAEKGPAGFTFADAARWAGVSPAAPYRHFRDRDELFGGRGAARLRAIHRGAGEGLGRRQAGCRSLPSTGSAKPISISPSTSRPITRRCSKPACRSMPIRNCARRASTPSRCCAAAAEKLVALMPAKGRPPALMVALHIWSLTHGIASLFCARRRGAARFADATGGTAGSGLPDLSARPGAAPRGAAATPALGGLPLFRRERDGWLSQLARAFLCEGS